MTTRLSLIRVTWGLAPAALVAFGVTQLAAGCGGGDEPKFAPQPGADAGVVDAAPPPPPPMEAGPPPAATGPCDGTMTLAVTSMLQTRQKTDAPGMTAEGGAVCFNGAEGQAQASPTIMLQPGFCYTVLGQALPNVSELDLSLTVDTAAIAPAAAALFPNPLLAQDSDTGVVANIAAGKNCYKVIGLLPVPAKVQLKARTGNGPVAAMVFKKKAQ